MHTGLDHPLGELVLEKNFDFMLWFHAQRMRGAGGVGGRAGGLVLVQMAPSAP